MTTTAAEGICVGVACRVPDALTLGCDASLNRPLRSRQIRRTLLRETICRIHAASCATSGSRPGHAELAPARGLRIGGHQVKLLMHRAGLAGATGRLRFKRCKPNTVSADLVDRKCTRQGPDQLWVTDSTDHHTGEEKVCCAVVLDVSSRVP